MQHTGLAIDPTSCVRPAERFAPGDWALWLMPLAVAIAVFRQPVGIVDIGWQIALGRRIAEYGPWLREIFVASHRGEALVPNAWAAQVLYAWAFDHGGLRLLRAIDAIAWLSGPLVVALSARQRGGAAAVALGLALLLAEPTGLLRPQSFAALGFGLMLVLGRATDWRRVALPGAVVFVVWQNLHPSVGLAALCLAVMAGFALIQRGTDAARALAVLALLAGLALFATPAGLAVLDFARGNTAASLAFGATEWFPLWHPYHREKLLAVIATALLALAIGWRERRDLRAVEVVPLAITFVMALFAARFILFYAIALIPLLARIAPANAAPRHQGLAWVAAMAGVAGLSWVLPVTEQYRDVARAVLRQGGTGTVFCDPLLGGAIALDGDMHRAVAFDSRYYLYTPAEVALLRRAAIDPAALAAIEQVWHPDAYALLRARSPALIAALAARPSWRKAYDNGAAVVYVRR